jgi:hypothetical protein
MVLADLWNFFQEKVFPLPSTDRLFNPFRDVDPRVDLPEGRDIRRANLFGYLSSFKRKPPLLLIGEAAGPWDCRFSGVPFTGERDLCTGALPFRGERSSRAEPLLTSGRTPPYTSQTAAIFWGVLRPRHSDFLVWNCVPFHPHREGRILSVRPPDTGEIRRFLDPLASLDRLLRPERIIAIGRRAEQALKAAGLSAPYVRHPSQGGARQFRDAMGQLFGQEGGRGGVRLSATGTAGSGRTNDAVGKRFPTASYRKRP